MPFITREDGEHFVIPSYRDVLSAKQKSVLKKEILLLSQNYGEYITMQRKNALQYEVAFSPDTGYLLGESIWHEFKRPSDMIYCEIIPNTTEAILVIVKSGSVYLDGSFPLENIPEELVIFLTQQNNFEIYTYGDVSISETPQEGKFSFEATSVKSFTVLDKPIFPTLPLLKIYQLQPVDTVLRAQGIGVFPAKKLVIGGVIAVAAWMFYSYITAPEPVGEMVAAVTAPKVHVSPYKEYMDELTSPAPENDIKNYLAIWKVILTMPGWVPTTYQYSDGNVTVSVLSLGGKMEDLLAWGRLTHATIIIKREGVSISMNSPAPKRTPPAKIYPIDEVIAKLVDNISMVYPGNNLSIKTYTNKGQFKIVKFTLSIESSTPLLLDLIKEQLKGMPIVLQNINTVIDTNKASSIITFDALGG